MNYLPRIALLFVCHSGEAIAHAPKEGDVWATASPFFYRSITDAKYSKGSPNVGGAIVAEGDVDYNGGVEIAMIYVDKTYVSHTDEDSFVERIKRVHITTGYRHWFMPWVSAGAAFFSSYSMGDAQVIDDNRPSGRELETSARDITEYGFDFSVQWEVWRQDEFAVVADSRYFLSTTRKIHEDADLYGVLLGIKYLVPKSG